MNKLVLILFTIALFIACNNSNNKSTEITSDLIQNPITASNNSGGNELPIINFTHEIHDFGIIIQGEKVSHNFKFKNTGKSNLLIKDASASCGCTVPSFPTKPIPPGGEGVIEVIFNSANRSGRQHKSITVISNTQPNTTHLQIECEIVTRK